jgi:Ulp1 family protease
MHSHPEPWKSNVKYNEFRLIAFPVHVQNPHHFTLGIMVNLHWKIGQNDQKWTLFHLDSMPCHLESRKHALAFGKHLLGLDPEVEIEGIEVPVIHQSSGSNDCGFFPAYFLELFLSDVDYYIEQCLEVSKLSSTLYLPIQN